MRSLKIREYKTRSGRVRNDQIRQKVGTDAVVNKLEALRLRWLRYMTRMLEKRSRDAKKRWKGRPEGTRPFRRPRRR